MEVFETDLDYDNFNLEAIREKINAARDKVKTKILAAKEAREKAITIDTNNNSIDENNDTIDENISSKLKSYLSKKNLMIVGGVVILGLGGYFAYKKFR